MAPRSPGGQAAYAGRTTLTVSTLAMCGIVVSLQQTLVIPLLPDFPLLLQTTSDNASWLVTATIVAGAVATPMVSRLADMFGKKRMLLIGLAVCVLGSIVGGLSNALVLVVAARAMQGVGMALIPVGIAVMRDELPRKRLPLGVALMGATLAVGAGAGLPLSGLIAEHLDWHSIFWLTAAVGTVLFLAATRVLAESTVRTGGTFDYPGALLLSGALVALLLAVSKGGQWGWASRPTLTLAALGLVLLLVWVHVELRSREPLLDVRLAARPRVLFVHVASLFLGYAMFANMLVTSQLLRAPPATGYGLGQNLLHTGLWMAPTAFVFGGMAPVVAWMVRRYGPQATLVAGAVVMAVSYVARVWLSAELWQVVAGSMLVGLGTSMTFSALPMLVMRAVPATETASANGLNLLLRSIGMSCSSAAIAAVTSIGAVSVDGVYFPSFGALAAVFCLAALMSAASALLALLLVLLPDRARTSSDSYLVKTSL